MFYYELFEALHKAHVRYLVVGGLSVNLHGVPRVTADVDLVIAMDRKNIQSLANVLKAPQFPPASSCESRGVIRSGEGQDMD